MRFHAGHEGPVLAVIDLPGAGVPRVYLGGLGSASTVAFAEVVNHPVVAGRRTLLVDLPGSGWSDHPDGWGAKIERHADAVAGFIEAAAVGPVELVGHSLGGSVAISLTFRHPGLARRLVVCEPNLDPGVGTFSATIAAWTEDDFVDRGHAEIVDRLLVLGSAGDTNAAEFARTVARWSPATLHRTAVSLLADRAPTFRQQLIGLDLPRLLIMGDQTRTDEPDLLDAGVEVVVVPDAGHVMMTDNLDAFCAAIA